MAGIEGAISQGGGGATKKKPICGPGPVRKVNCDEEIPMSENIGGGETRRPNSRQTSAADTRKNYQITAKEVKGRHRPGG